jgi:hypothetical protein
VTCVRTWPLSIRGARWQATAAGRCPCVRRMPQPSTLQTCGHTKVFDVIDSCC